MVAGAGQKTSENGEQGLGSDRQCQTASGAPAQMGSGVIVETQAVAMKKSKYMSGNNPQTKIEEGRLAAHHEGRVEGRLEMEEGRRCRGGVGEEEGEKGDVAAADVAVAVANEEALNEEGRRRRRGSPRIGSKETRA